MSRLRDVSDNEAECLLDLYNAQTAHLPLCRAAEQSEFLESLLHPNGSDTMGDSRIIIAEAASGEVVGFVHVAVGTFSDVYGAQQEGGAIHFLTYRPGHRFVGKALLGVAEDHARLAGAMKLWAFHLHLGYPCFHLAYGTVSDRAGHMCSLLHMEGYEPSDEWVWLSWRDYRIVEPIPPGQEYQVVAEVGKPGEWTLRLQRDCEAIGVCSSRPIEVERDQHPWLYLADLFVEGQGRGKGWGRYLVLQLLWLAQEAGFRHTLLQTLLGNHTAQLLYTNLGYEVCDVARGYCREL